MTDVFVSTEELEAYSDALLPFQPLSLARWVR